MRVLLFAALPLVAAPASAEVVSSSANAFHLRQTVTVPVAPEDAYVAFAKVERWWDPAHTFSGDAKALSMELTAGGCFCEALPSGGVEHMRIVHMDMPKRLVLSGGLGPLAFEAVAGAMELKFEPAPGGSKVTMEYKAAGFASGGADKLAGPVDQVLAEQMKRYRGFASAK